MVSTRSIFVGLGMFNAVTTWIEDVVAPRGFSSEQAGLTALEAHEEGPVLGLLRLRLYLRDGADFLAVHFKEDIARTQTGPLGRAVGPNARHQHALAQVQQAGRVVALELARRVLRIEADAVRALAEREDGWEHDGVK